MVFHVALIADAIGKCVPAQKLGMVTYTYNLSIQKTEAGMRVVSSRPVWGRT